MLVHDIDRRTVLRTGLAGGLAAAGAAVLGGCDSGGTRPGTAYGVTGTARAGPSEAPARAGALVLPGSPLVAQAEQARFTTGRVRSRAIELVAGEVDLGGPVVRTWSYDGVVPGPVIRVAKGDLVRVTFTSRIPQPTTVHWHGVALRNDMDGTLVTQQPIRPGGSFTYQFKAAEPGTYWYHPHVGTQIDRGLYGMLIVEDPAEPGGYDQEWLVVIDDWIDGVRGYTPDKVHALLRQGMGGMSGGSMGSMGPKGGGGVLLSGATSPLLGGDAGDVRYPAYLINGRVPAAPHVFTGKPGQRVRIRILNAGGDTAFRVALGGHVMTVTHTDGHPCQPVRTRALLLGMAERYDVLVTLKDGVFPLVAYAEGKNATALAVVRTGTGAVPAPGVRPAELAGVLRGYRKLQPPASAAPPGGQPDMVSRQELTGNMGSYSWGFGGRMYPMGDEFLGPSYPRLVRVRQSQRMRITWVNTTKMWHPMHIHGHTFRVNGTGPLKDTVNVLPGQTVTCDFDTDNPGQWMTHCHNVYHELSGMMGIIGYIT
jgi:FtsP/CotA-like multicopper oxidase with cupredoxin domain